MRGVQWSELMRCTAFATCTKSRTFSMVWACRAQKLAMNGCMLQFQGQDELDKARAEW